MKMRRPLPLLLFCVVLASSAVAQSGRKAPPQPSPTPAPPEPAKKEDKAQPPQIVDGERIYVSREVDQKAVIHAKPKPGYSREARRQNTRGIVVLRVILAADETVKHIEVLTGLPNGLSDKAIEAAEKIKFTPAMKDGKRVSLWVQLEYRFNLH